MKGLVASPVVQRPLRLVSLAALALLVSVLFLVATATVPVLFGYHTYTIKGASMEPALRKGSVAVSSPTSPRALRVGDIIAWRASPEHPPVLHRIVKITDDNGQLGFITQGDQNSTPDPVPEVLVGPGDRVVYSVPYAGYVVDFVSNPPTRAALIGLPLLLLAAASLRKVRSGTTVKTTSSVEHSSAGDEQRSVIPPVVTPAFQPRARHDASRQPGPALAIPSPVTLPPRGGQLPAFLAQQVLQYRSRRAPQRSFGSLPRAGRPAA